MYHFIILPYHFILIHTFFFINIQKADWSIKQSLYDGLLYNVIIQNEMYKYVKY